MGVISFRHSGNFKNLERSLQKAKRLNLKEVLEKHGVEGVRALSAATPKDSGTTANSWDYIVTETNNSVTINWTNSNINDGVSIAVIIQYGHATGSGGYVQGIDYINPALRPVFEKIANSVWKEVT